MSVKQLEARLTEIANLTSPKLAGPTVAYRSADYVALIDEYRTLYPIWVEKIHA